MLRLPTALVMAMVLSVSSPAASNERTPEWAAAEQQRGEDLFAAQDFIAAEAAYGEALDVRTRPADSRGRAESKASAGAAQSFRGRRSRDTALLEGAVRDHRAALEAYTRADTPTEWAEVQNNLATALVWIAHVRGDGSAAELEDAERSFSNRLEVKSPETAPTEAGVVLSNIGTVQERIGDRLSDADQITRHRQASATNAQALDALRRGGQFSYASDVERRVSPFMNRIAQVD